jgi:hypothetical protein
MAAAIARVEDRVARSGAGPLLAEPVRLPGLPIPTDALRLGAHAVALGAPELAAGITRRMAHFAAAADAVRTGGVLIDVPAWFDDAPPIQLAQVRRTGADLVRLIGTDPDALRAATVGEIGDRLAGLTPATRQAVISRLRGAPLAVLAGAVRRLTGRRGTVSTADLATVAALPDLLLAGAPAAMLDEIVRILPDLEPRPPSRPGAPADPDDPHDVGAGSRDSRDDPVIRSGISPSDVGQGGVEDCYLAAALVGVALQNPRILADGIRENPNGTLTVTFYGRRGGGGGGGGGAGGRPFPVTVTRRLPVSDGPIPIAMDQHDLLGRPEDWPAGYEKAYARANGGYDAISGGDAGVAASQLTGYPHRTVAPAALPVAEIRARLDAGDVVTVSTRDRPRARDGSGLVGRHAYTVVGADVAGGRVLLRNPWAHPGTQLLTWYDWEALCPGLHSAALTPTR